MQFKENKAIYLQIADRLCDEIVQARYREEERIPSVREYAALVEVNANTVMRSYDHLQQEGILFNKRGLGYYVAPGARRRIERTRRTLFLGEEAEAFFRNLQSLHISPEELLQMYRQFIDSHPSK